MCDPASDWTEWAILAHILTLAVAAPLMVTGRDGWLRLKVAIAAFGSVAMCVDFALAVMGLACRRKNVVEFAVLLVTVTAYKLLAFGVAWADVVSLPLSPPSRMQDQTIGGEYTGSWRAFGSGTRTALTVGESSDISRALSAEIRHRGIRWLIKIRSRRALRRATTTTIAKDLAPSHWRVCCHLQIIVARILAAAEYLGSFELDLVERLHRPATTTDGG